jgi:hypothetical protein
MTKSQPGGNSPGQAAQPGPTPAPRRIPKAPRRKLGRVLRLNPRGVPTSDVGVQTSRRVRKDQGAQTYRQYLFDEMCERNFRRKCSATTDTSRMEELGPLATALLRHPEHLV